MAYAPPGVRSGTLDTGIIGVDSEVTSKPVLNVSAVKSCPSRKPDSFFAGQFGHPKGEFLLGTIRAT